MHVHIYMFINIHIWCYIVFACLTASPPSLQEFLCSFFFFSSINSATRCVHPITHKQVYRQESGLLDWFMGVPSREQPCRPFSIFFFFYFLSKNLFPFSSSNHTTTFLLYLLYLLCVYSIFCKCSSILSMIFLPPHPFTSLN